MIESTFLSRLCLLCPLFLSERRRRRRGERFFLTMRERSLFLKFLPSYRIFPNFSLLMKKPSFTPHKKDNLEGIDNARFNIINNNNNTIYYCTTSSRSTTERKRLTTHVPSSNIEEERRWYRDGRFVFFILIIIVSKSCWRLP